MSTYDDTYNDNDVECPYCKHKYQPESEDYDVEERSEECEECGKKYYLSQSFSISHTTQPDCELNGQRHDYEMVTLRDDTKHPLCAVCGKYGPIVQEDN